MPLDIDFKGHVLCKEGKAEGKAEGMRKVVLQLLREGVLDLSRAAKTLGVTESEVLAMAKNVDQ